MLPIFDGVRDVTMLSTTAWSGSTSAGPQASAPIS